MTEGIINVILAIVGVAIIAVLVSKQAQTGSVVTAGGGAVSNFLCTALSPVAGGSCGGGGGGLIPNVTSSISFGNAL